MAVRGLIEALRMSFPSEIFDQLGYYVYRLIDPRSGQTFYVGKGRGNRVFAHAKGLPDIEYRDENDDDFSLKMDELELNSKEVPTDPEKVTEHDDGSLFGDYEETGIIFFYLSILV